MKMKCRFHLLGTIGTQMVRMETHWLRVNMRRPNTSRGLGTVGSTGLTMIFWMTIVRVPREVREDI